MQSRVKLSVLLLTIMLLVSCIVFFSNIGKAVASSRTITVPDDFPTIQAAIDNANAGDTIFVKSGIYDISIGGRTRNITTIIGPMAYYTGLTIDKPLTLVGQECSNTIISAIFDFPGWGIEVKSDNIVISGFTMITDHTAFDIQGSNISLTNNIIRLNSTYHNVINIQQTQGSVIISSNIIEGGYCGIGIFSGTVTVYNNMIRFSSTGIVVGATIGNQIIFNNTISNNSISVSFSKPPSLFYYNNILNYSQYSVYLGTNTKYPELLGTSENVNATFNYWGTTDEAVIENSIYDHKNDSSLGVVNFTPFSTEPYSQDIPDQNSPSPIDCLSGIVIATLLVLIVVVFIVIYRRYQ